MKYGMKAAILALPCFFAAPAFALNEVTLCERDTESGQGRNLQQAIAAGGVVTFRCPRLLATIRMTAEHLLPPSVTLDGGNKVTLDGEGSFLHMFKVEQGPLFVRDITIRNARKRPAPPPPNVRPPFKALGKLDPRPTVFDTKGFLSLEGVKIEDSDSPVSAQGGAYVIRSDFLRNVGAALNVYGEAWVEDTKFLGNETGLTVRRGRVVRADFRDNRAGALRVPWPDGELRISGSKFIGNKGEGALQLSQRSARTGNGVVIVRASKFEDNLNSDGGGAITIYDLAENAPAVVREILHQFPPARFEFAYDDFSNNRGTSGAIQADLQGSGGLSIIGATFVGNAAEEYGGAIAWANGPISISHAFFQGNYAGKSGSAMYAVTDAALPPQQEVVNTLIVENRAPGLGAAVDVGPTSLLNVTIAKNVGIGVAARLRQQPLIANTILSQNTEGNCKDIADEFLRAGNLQFGKEDCPGTLVGNPFLDTAFVPVYGSPALKLGDVSVCTDDPVGRRDIVFQGRAFGGTCATGAFEYFPKQTIKRLDRSRDKPREEVERPAKNPEPVPSERRGAGQ